MAFRNRRAASLPAKLSRSWLLVNASKPEDFAPALASEADSVIFDMEAAVPDDKKDEARDSVVEALSTGMTAWVRVNGIDTDFWAKDLAALSKTPGLRGVMLAMTEKPEQVTYTAMRLQAGTPVLALVESAVGIENATAIASAPGTFRLAFGVNDFRKDTGVSGDPLALAYARGKLVVASRVGKLPGAIDGPPAPGAGAEEVLAESAITASMGMTGKLRFPAPRSTRSTSASRRAPMNCTGPTTCSMPTRPAPPSATAPTCRVLRVPRRSPTWPTPTDCGTPRVSPEPRFGHQAAASSPILPRHGAGGERWPRLLPNAPVRRLARRPFRPYTAAQRRRTVNEHERIVSAATGGPGRGRESPSPNRWLSPRSSSTGRLSTGHGAAHSTPASSATRCIRYSPT